MIRLAGMNDVDPDDLKHALESEHGCIAVLAQSVPVRERFGNQTVWDGIVHIFDLEGHPKTKRAYAWSALQDDGKRAFITVLHLPPITLPKEAVRALVTVLEKSSSCVVEKADFENALSGVFESIDEGSTFAVKRGVVAAVGISSPA